MSATLEEMVQKEREAGCLFGPFHQQWLERKRPDRVREMLELAARRPEIIAARQGLATMDVNDVNESSFAAQNTSASELNIVGNTQAIINQFCALPPNDAKSGKVYRVNFGGTYGNTGTPTLTVTPRWGSSPTPATNVSLGASSAWTTITGTTGLPYFGEFIFTIRSKGLGATAGSGVGTGVCSFQIPATSSQITADVMFGNTVATIDTTGQGAAGCGITINFTWSASSASNTSTCLWWILRSLN